MTNIRSVMGAMDLDQMLPHRATSREHEAAFLHQIGPPYPSVGRRRSVVRPGKVNRIEIKDIVPPADLVQSMGRQMKAEREKRADILEAEGSASRRSCKAEGQKQAQILEPRAGAKRRSATPRPASASAQAEAKATQMVARRGANGDIAALNYFVADKYIKALTVMPASTNRGS